MSKKNLLLCTGFLLFVIGISALGLSLVGIKYSFLQWIDLPGPLFGFAIKLCMIVAGAVCVVVATTDWEREKKDSSRD